MNTKIHLQKKCDAKSKRTGNRCQGLAMKNGKCRVHGGKSLKGSEAPKFRHGKFSKVFQDLNLFEKYEVFLNDPKLIELREELALVDTLVKDRLEKLAAGESKDAWLEVKKGFKKYREIRRYLNSSAAKTLKEGSEPKYTEKDASAVLDNIENILAVGMKRYSAFEVIQPMLEQRRKLAESEIRRKAKLDLLLPAKVALEYAVILGNIVKKYVRDPSDQTAISQEFLEVTKSKVLT